jgi:hypothetical protein
MMQTLQITNASSTVLTEIKAVFIMTLFIMWQLAVEYGGADANDLDDIDLLIEIFIQFANPPAYLMQALRDADTLLFDITPHKEAQPRQYTCPKNI